MTASRSVLVEVLTVLAKDRDNLAVVGGWVPELAFPGKGHVGSLDVDLALDARHLKPSAYESIRKKLIDAGYQQSPNPPNRFFRRLAGRPLQVKVDLITGEFPDVAAAGTHHQIQELAVCKLRGIDLAFAFPQEVEVEGVLPDGGHNRVTAKVPSIPAFVCIKAIALGERKKDKDAYDIAFCIDHFPGGYRGLAAAFAGTRENDLMVEGLAVLRDKFARLDGIGPVWAAQVAVGATTGTADDLEGEQRRAYEVVNGLLRELDGLGMA